MDESLSLRAKLLKSNINITNIDWENGLLYYDFAYRPYSGAPQRWCKTVSHVIFNKGVKSYIDWGATVDNLKNEVLALRKELEN